MSGLIKNFIISTDGAENLRKVFSIFDQFSLYGWAEKEYQVKEHDDTVSTLKTIHLYKSYKNLNHVVPFLTSFDLHDKHSIDGLCASILPFIIHAVKTTNKQSWYGGDGDNMPGYTFAFIDGSLNWKQDVFSHVAYNLQELDNQYDNQSGTFVIIPRFIYYGK